jgi:hypothetical protein
MVSEERQPSFHGIWISRGSPDPSRDTPFRDVETQFEQFAVNARCSPGRILGNQSQASRRTQECQQRDSRLDLPYPPDPVHNGSGSDQNERLPPPGPDRSQRNPEQLVHGSQSMVRSLRVQSQQLPTESQVLKDEALAGTASADHPAEEMSEPRDHSKNLSGKVQTKLCAKSFILLVYDVCGSKGVGRAY